ncbi:hypothetical protein QAD02_001413 [Eretmocerus hayati]|uniref:Uncharacterized protein n=1 Tax=Eretmocerus hayati TaxID=131215 RepID=A0ACC2NGE2_9HYME|nr:hypothetical protein QAD02_001413 [Eretmocerus hayati]
MSLHTRQSSLMKGLIKEHIKNCFEKSWTNHELVINVEIVLEETSNDEWDRFKTGSAVDCETFQEFVSYDDNLAVCGVPKSSDENNDEIEENSIDAEISEDPPARDDVIKALDSLELHARTNDVSLEFVECLRRINRDCLEHLRQRSEMKQAPIKDYLH